MGIGLATVLILGCGAGTVRQSRPAQRPPAPPGTEAPIAEAQRLGRIMLVHDVAAARATDELIRTGVPLTPEAGVRGWITVPGPTGIVVRFVGEHGGVPAAFHDVAFSSTGIPTATRLTPPWSLPEEQAAAYRARQTAIQDTPANCSDRYNTIVMKNDMAPGDDWIVYILPATTVVGRVMVGRVHRVTVSPDGRQVVENRPLSKDCMAIDLLQAGREPAAMAVTNLVSPTPNESHVFLSLLHRTPIAVATSLGTWMVAEGRIEYLGPHD